ncbi:MAG: CBS domain-containing protein, partial [Victivallaceae bacterium]|nr:CBS domain-containing protein [Victivallaceae bacterium]
RGFTKEDYGRLHPGGAIGRAVTMRIRDIMRSGDRLALVSPDTTVKDTLLKITAARSGAALIVDAERHLLGIFTDGDFRRHIERGIEVLSTPVSEVMSANPIYVPEDSLAVEALKILEKRHINAIIAVDAEKRVTGLVDVQDLPRCKLM